MQHLERAQRGATMSGILFALAILALLAMVAIKLAPHYMNFMTVRSVMNELQEDPQSAGRGRRAVLEVVDKRLYINDVRTVSAKDFDFSREGGANELSVQYEVREHLFGNIDAVLTFNHKVQLESK
jgi:hypothetical protein